MASTSKGKFRSAMLYKIKVFVFSFSLGSNHKTNVISEKKNVQGNMQNPKCCTCSLVYNDPSSRSLENES